MSDKLSRTIYVIDARESVALSWARDTFSIGCLLAAAWFVNVVIPPSGWFNALVCFLWLIWIIGRDAKRRLQKTPDQARAWLDEQFPDHAQSTNVEGV